MKSFLIAVVLFSCTVPRQQDNSAVSNTELSRKIEMQNRKIEQLLSQDAQKQELINQLTQKANDPTFTDEEREEARTERRGVLLKLWDTLNDSGVVDAVVNATVNAAVNKAEEYLDNQSSPNEQNPSGNNEYP